MIVVLFVFYYNALQNQNLSWWYVVAQLVDALRYKFAGSIPDGVIGIFH
jgi:hypothetical protein